MGDASHRWRGAFFIYKVMKLLVFISVIMLILGINSSWPYNYYILL